jgi:hypothetical protein
MSLQEALKASANEAAKAQAELLKERYIEFHSALFSSTSKYDNAVILGGFAAFFALWAGTAGDIPRFARLITVALMGLSLMVYIGVTVGQMLLRQFHVEWKRGDVFEKYASDAVAFNKEWAKIDKSYNEKLGKLLRPFVMGFWVSLGSGFAAGLLLTYSALAVAFGWPVLVGWS